MKIGYGFGYVLKGIQMMGIFSSLIVLLPNISKAEIQTVPFVDIGRYAGTWYQIARNPHPFERGCVCARQVLAPADQGKISVYNSCNFQNANGNLLEIRGLATNVDPQTNSKFTVDFNLPNLGHYWIIGLDTQYRYAVVSDPTGKTLYVLSKTPELSAELFSEAVEKAAEQLDTTQLTLTPQINCSYPSEN
jgi:apolipoprotein D and lipocalin family protein